MSICSNVFFFFCFFLFCFVCFLSAVLFCFPSLFCYFVGWFEISLVATLLGHLAVAHLALHIMFDALP